MYITKRLHLFASYIHYIQFGYNGAFTWKWILGIMSIVFSKTRYRIGLFIWRIWDCGLKLILNSNLIFNYEWELLYVL